MSNPGTLTTYALLFFGLAVMGSIVLYVLSIFWTQSTFSGIFGNNSYAANFTNLVSEAIYNIAEQLPNAGKLLGVTVIIGVVALMGVGGYMGYKKGKDNGWV